MICLQSKNIICSSKVLLLTIDHRDIIINHIRKVILNNDDNSTNTTTTTTTSSTRNNIYRTLWSNPVTYSYQLKDCNHIACGRCIWTGTSSAGNDGTYTSTKNCKNYQMQNNSKIRSCPPTMKCRTEPISKRTCFFGDWAEPTIKNGFIEMTNGSI